MDSTQRNIFIYNGGRGGGIRESIHTQFTHCK